MKKALRDLLLVLGLALVPTILVWLPFFLKIEKVWTILLGKDGMATIISNYDGPLYVVVAKTLYNRELIKQIIQISKREEFCRSIAFIENYDMSVAR